MLILFFPDHPLSGGIVVDFNVAAFNAVVNVFVVSEATIFSPEGRSTIEIFRTNHFEGETIP